MSKSMLIIDTPKSCADCRLRNGLFCGTNGNSLYDYIHYDDSLNDKPSWCPLKEYKKAIPIEWIEKWLSKKVFVWDATTMANEKDRLQAIENIKYGFETMLLDWEEENEAD